VFEFATASGTTLERFCAIPGTSVLIPPQIADADEHWMAVANGEVQARCSLWWSTARSVDGKRAGYIGHYGALSQQAGRELLRHACARLQSESCELAIGPIDGSTWKRYRLLTERGAEPPFFLEPDNPDDWPAHFTSAGFVELAHYSSASDADLAVRDPRVPELEARMSSLNVRIRNMDSHTFRSELERIYSISLVSFQNAFLYSPLSRAECIALYEPLEKYVRPELVFLAERNDEPLGFVFSVPDWLQAKRGLHVDTMIVKTLAIVPQHELSGLGGLLLDRCRQRGLEIGYRRAIHALIHDGNASSRRLSSRFGTTIRGYALYSRSLSA